MPSISAIKVPIGDTQKDQLRTLFASPGWSVLREIISARCIEAQASFMDASMYPTDNATDKAAHAKDKAVGYNLTLDVLDEVERNMEEWYRITLEPRR